MSAGPRLRKLAVAKGDPKFSAITAVDLLSWMIMKMAMRITSRNLSDTKPLNTRAANFTLRQLTTVTRIIAMTPMSLSTQLLSLLAAASFGWRPP